MLNITCSSRSPPTCRCPVCPRVFAKTDEFLLPTVTKRTFPAGKSITNECEPINGVCFVVSGAAKVFECTRNGQQLIQKFVFAGEFLKMHPWRAALSGDVAALTDVRVCDIEYRWNACANSAFPEIDRALFSAAIGESIRHEIRLRILTSKKPIDRLIFFLADIALRTTRQNGKDRLVELPMNRADIADYLGLQRETVSRSFSDLRSEGHISSLNRDSCVIRDFEKFRKLVDFDVHQPTRAILVENSEH